MKIAVPLLILLCFALAILSVEMYKGGVEDGLKEGYANGRERERELWQQKPPPEPRVIEVKVPVPVETVKVIEVPYAVIERKIEPVDKVITETKVYQVRTGCVGGCKCNETGERESD